MGGARSKNIFHVFRVPFDYPTHSLEETVLPKPMIQMESRDSEGVPFASLESLGPGIWHLNGAEKWSHDITKIEIFINTHVEKFADSKMLLFLIYGEK